MSVHVTAAVWDLRMPPVDRVSGAALKLVALALADYASREGDGIFPATATICGMTSLTRRTIQAALAGLRSYQIIVQTAPPTPRSPAAYRFGPWYAPPAVNPGARGAMVAPLGRNDRASRGAMVAPNPLSNRQLSVGACAVEDPKPNPAAAMKARIIREQLASAPSVS